MELLQQLEQRVFQLLEELQNVKAQRDSASTQQADTLAMLTEENALLKQQLQEEKQRNAEALKRVENIMQLIKEHAEQV